MKFTTTVNLTTIAMLSLLATNALAKVSSADAAKLGKELTPIGAERAGNADGSIPEWTGGMTKAPTGYQGKGTTRIDPFADETPLFTITASNYSEYADKLTVGQQALFAKYPDTYKMPIYQSHRTAAAPQSVYSNTISNATNAELTSDGNGIVNAYGGFPFPIPQNGTEAIWNHILRWTGEGSYKDFRNSTVYNNGKKTIGGGLAWEAYPFYNADTTAANFSGTIWEIFVKYTLPIRRKGEVILVVDQLDQSKTPRQAWQYIPGQRRVRRAPTIAFDTPNAQFGGQSTYDDSFMYNGSPERYDWKLVGKKETYISYNNNKLITSLEEEGGADAFETPNHPNPEFTRYELHRVWVVEATLKENKRHIYGKRTMYIDEDTWAIVATDIYDGRGELWRVGGVNMLNAYDVPLTLMRAYYHTDLQNGAYSLNEVDLKPIDIYEGEKPKFFTPAQVRKMSKR
jgi:hypothetical protein